MFLTFFGAYGGGGAETKMQKAASPNKNRIAISGPAPAYWIAGGVPPRRIYFPIARVERRVYLKSIYLSRRPVLSLAAPLSLYNLPVRNRAPIAFGRLREYEITAPRKTLRAALKLLGA